MFGDRDRWEEIIAIQYRSINLERAISSEIAAKIRSSVLNIEEQEDINFDEGTPKLLQQAIDTLVTAKKKTTWKIEPIDLPPSVCCNYCFNDSIATATSIKTY